MPNVEKINELIAWIEADQAKHFKMQNWVNSLSDPSGTPATLESCDTAFCLGGHIYLAKMLREGHKPKVIDFRILSPDMIGNIGADELGITYSQANRLFIMDGSWQRKQFDALPDELRAKGAISALTLLRDEYTVDWGEALYRAGISLDDDNDEDDEDYDDA